MLSNSTFAYVDDSDAEAEMDYEDDEDDDEMDEDVDPEPVSDELPGLLFDAQQEVADIVQQAGQSEMHDH